MTLVNKRRKILQEKRIRRARRIRQKIKGVSAHPRLSVFRSQRRIYAQIIDDASSRTIAFSSGTLREAHEVGKNLAERAKKAKILRVVFDKGSYAFHGHVAALAKGAREGGLNF